MTMAAQEPPSEEAQPVGRSLSRSAFLTVFLALTFLTVALVVFSVPAGVYAVFSGRLSQISWTSLGHPYLWVGPVFQSLSFITVSIGSWFLFLTAVYCLFMAIAFRERGGPLSAIRSAFRDGSASLMTSPFLAFVIGTGFLAFTATIIDSVVSSSGAAIGGPLGDPLELLLGVTAAPLVEELGFRVMLIGSVALILSIGRSWRDALGSLWRPSKALEGIAVGSGATIIIWAATAFSAATFGACHVFCGTTWDLGKLPEATYGGLVLGVLYVKYGFHVAVLVHWGINYFGSVYAFFGQAAYGVPWTSTVNEFAGQLLVDVDMLLLFGLASFLLVLYLVLRRFSLRRDSLAAEGFDKGPLQGGTVEP